jgi:hypothetical protein
MLAVGGSAVWVWFGTEVGGEERGVAGKVVGYVPIFLHNSFIAAK